MIDLIIVGAGPAGMTAALYAARAGLGVKVLECSAIGGQISSTASVENYPAVDESDGASLSDKMKEQAQSFGAEFVNAKAVSVNRIDGDGDEQVVFAVRTASSELKCRSVILANGVKRRRLGCEGEKEFEGRGVSWCAICDGRMFKDKTVAVIGGGNSAVEDALYLATLCRKVYIVHRREQLRADSRLTALVNRCDSIEFLIPYRVDKIIGNDTVSGIEISNVLDGTAKTVDVDGVFEAIGLEPENADFSNVAELDDNGYYASDESCRTVTAGVYVAGDARVKPLRQIVTAVSDGAVAATQAVHFLRSK